jgi:acetyl-CoA C-acetyltransferase
VFTTMIHEMKRRDKTIGLATLCLGGGEAVALIVKRA